MSEVTREPPFVIVSSLRQDFQTCSEAYEAAKFRLADEAVASLVGCLESIIDCSPPPDYDNAFSREEAAKQALLEIRLFISSPTSNQMAVDAVSLAVPQAVTKLAEVSSSCRDIAESVISTIVSTCSPLELLTIFCEALDTVSEVSKASTQVLLLLNGLSKVLSCIKRNHVQQLKVALPVVIRAVHSATVNSDQDCTCVSELLNESVAIAASIDASFENSIGEMKQLLQAVLALYLLQIMAVVSKSCIANEACGCVPLILSLSRFIPVCGLSYVGLITGSDVDNVYRVVQKGLKDDDDFLSCCCNIKDGASLAVVWGISCEEVANAAGEELKAILDIVRRNQTKRWQALNMFRYVLVGEYPWWMKFQVVDMLSDIMEGRNLEQCMDLPADWSSLMLSLFAALQALQKFVIYSPEASYRRKGFSLFKNVISDLPPSEQFDVLKALITNSSSPSMVAILVDIAKEKVRLEYQQRKTENNEEVPKKLAWLSRVLELVEFILKPPQGGPPALPEQSEPILSVLNLYRFLLITEATGTTNFSGALSKDTLQRAYTEWLLPLRGLVSGIEAEGRNDDSETVCDVLCALNPLQLVLYRCIELVENQLKADNLSL